MDGVQQPQPSQRPVGGDAARGPPRTRRARRGPERTGDRRQGRRDAGRSCPEPTSRSSARERTTAEARAEYGRATAESWTLLGRSVQTAHRHDPWLLRRWRPHRRAARRTCASAATDSQFGVPAARLGLGYGFDGVQKLTRVVGASWTAEILFSARRLDARRPAHRAGQSGGPRRAISSRPSWDLAGLDREERSAHDRHMQGRHPPDDAGCAGPRTSANRRHGRAVPSSEDYLEGQRAIHGEARTEIPWPLRSVQGTMTLSDRISHESAELVLLPRTSAGSAPRCSWRPPVAVGRPGSPRQPNRCRHEARRGSTHNQHGALRRVPP